MTTHTKLGLSTWLILALLMPACTILGVEPDEIDVADETGTSGASTNGEGIDEAGASDTGEEDPSTGGDGDGDTAQDTGDGDGDEAAGDGDGDGGGDGDGDGDGDTGTGDGDGDAETPCATYDPIVLGVGENPVEIFDEPSSFEGSCGSPGPDEVYSFPAPSDGTYEFTLASDAFEGVFYLVGEICVPIDEISCKVEGEAIEHDMVEGEVVFIIVDSDGNPGAATVSIAAI